MKEYLPILIVFVFVAGFAVTNVVLSHLVGRRNDTRAKLIPYECGMDPVGSAHQRFSVKFYLIAMFFILFDVEAIFLVPCSSCSVCRRIVPPPIAGRHSLRLGRSP